MSNTISANPVSLSLRRNETAVLKGWLVNAVDLEKFGSLGTGANSLVQNFHIIAKKVQGSEIPYADFPGITKDVTHYKATFGSGKGKIESYSFKIDPRIIEKTVEDTTENKIFLKTTKSISEGNMVTSRGNVFNTISGDISTRLDNPNVLKFVADIEDDLRSVSHPGSMITSYRGTAQTIKYLPKLKHNMVTFAGGYMWDADIFRINDHFRGTFSGSFLETTARKATMSLEIIPHENIGSVLYQGDVLFKEAKLLERGEMMQRSLKMVQSFLPQLLDRASLFSNSACKIIKSGKFAGILTGALAIGVGTLALSKSLQNQNTKDAA